jgi:type IV pilus assembly protein PilM
MVKAYYDLGALAGLNIVDLDYIGNSMLQLIKTQAQANTTTMVIQLGSESTVLNIVQGENLLLQRTVPYGTNSVVNVVMDDKGVDATTAMTLLQNDRMITVDFDDNEVTGAFRYLINNIGRVMDFYASKNPDKPIEDVLLTGDGALIKGIDGLFKVQLNVQTRIMDTLYNIKFDPSIDQKVYNPVYLVTPIGAAFAPMGFVLNETSSKAGAGTGPGMGLYVGIFVVCVIGAAAMAFYSIKAKKDAQDKQDQVQADIDKIADIEQIIADWEVAQGVYTDAYSMSSGTYHLNENCKTFIDSLEATIPSSVYITGFSSSDSGVSLPCVGTSYDDVAQLIINMKNISCLNPSSVNIPSLAKSVDDTTGEVTFTFSVSASYIPYNVEGGIVSELEAVDDGTSEEENTESEE